MDEDLIVDIEEHEAPPTPQDTMPATTSTGRPQRAAARNAMLRDRDLSPAYEPSESRATRSSTLRSRPQPKLKLKLSEKAAAQAPGMSFLGPYDRELDSDDDDLAFEEQFILRLSSGEDCEKLKKMVAAREISNDVWFKFKGTQYSGICHIQSIYIPVADSRRASFHIGNKTYSSKLVDLPCIIESQKTLDNKQMFKVADICQVTTFVKSSIP